MKKSKCSLCNSRKAKRKCSKHESMICPLCCVSIRHEDFCSKCSYFKAAQNYIKSKKSRKNNFIIEIDEEVEKSVDDALILIEQQKIDKGRRILSNLLQTHPKNHMVNYGLGVSYIFEGKDEKAIQFFTKAIQLFPYFVEAYFNLAMVYKNNLDLKNAVANFTKVAELGDPKEEFTKNAKSFLSSIEEQILQSDGISLDKYFKAQEIFEKSYLRMTEEKWELAKQGFKEVLETNPKHTQSLGNLGLCYGNLGEKFKALNTLDQALASDPHYEPAIINKKIIQSMQDGEPIPTIKMASVEYYKETYNTNKQSFIRSAVKKIIGK